MIKGFSIGLSVFTNSVFAKEKEIGIWGKKMKRVYLYSPLQDIGFGSYSDPTADIEDGTVYLTLLSKTSL